MSRQPPELLSFLHAHYTTALAHSHHTLAKLYRKLAALERRLTTTAVPQQPPLPRKTKKKLQWSRSLARAAIARLEAQHVYLRACAGWIAAGRHDTTGNSSPWSRPPPPPPPPEYWWEVEDGYSPTAPKPWCLTTMMGLQRTKLEYWDLSMLWESSSPLLSNASGIYEPVSSSGCGGGEDDSHTAAGRDRRCRPHDAFAAVHEDISCSPTSTRNDMETEEEEEEEKEEEEEEEEYVPSSTRPPAALSPTATVFIYRPAAQHTRFEAAAAAAARHRRGYSENTIRIVEDGIASGKRGTSVEGRMMG